MSQTLFFYDLETSGVDPRNDRIMQFAGMRTTLDLQPIGEPYNILVKLNDDTLPNPDAIIITGISPQQTVAEGFTEAEFAKFLMDEVFTKDTVTVGFNNIHFDDEFIRALFWRTFYDPYEWAWRDGRSRWDLLDAVRMTRALRPDGIEWPVIDGKEVNKLEALTTANGIVHARAHDALSDVEALIDVTRLLQTHQPQLYNYLFQMRDKNAVKQLVNLESKQPFVYVSGRYDQTYHMATVAFPLTAFRQGGVLVYNLRHDPTPLLEMSPGELAARLFATREERKQEGFIPVPVKEFHYNKSPAVAPLGVLSAQDGWERIGLDEALITKHRDILLSSPAFAENIRSVFESRPEFTKQADPEAQLYDGFLGEVDAKLVQEVRRADAQALADLHPVFIDERLPGLLLHYKARNYPQSLAEDEVVQWETWRAAHLKAQLPRFVARLQDLSKDADDTKSFLLQELQLWAESILPVDDL